MTLKKKAVMFKELVLTSLSFSASFGCVIVASSVSVPAGLLWLCLYMCLITFFFLLTWEAHVAFSTPFSKRPARISVGDMWLTSEQLATFEGELEGELATLEGEEKVKEEEHSRSPLASATMVVVP